MRQLKILVSITNRDEWSVEKYLQEISRYSLITPEEENELARQIKDTTNPAGSRRALEKLVLSNVRFVVSVAKQYQNQGLSLSDLINEGNFGLIKAATRFDETRGFKFISYAVWWIRQSILQALAELGRIVRLPMNKIGAHSKATKAYIAFEQEHEREPSVEELAEILDFSESEVHNIFTQNTRHTSLDAPVLETDDISMIDLIEDPTFSPEVDVMQSSFTTEVSRLLGALKPRQADILAAYFGLGGDDAPTIESVMDKYDLTKERVRQIKERAIKSLQETKSLNTNLLRAYLG